MHKWMKIQRTFSLLPATWGRLTSRLMLSWILLIFLQNLLYSVSDWLALLNVFSMLDSKCVYWHTVTDSNVCFRWIIRHSFAGKHTCLFGLSSGPFAGYSAFWVCLSCWQVGCCHCSSSCSKQQWQPVMVVCLPGRLPLAVCCISSTAGCLC